jgi:hypothetical protein
MTSCLFGLRPDPPPTRSAMAIYRRAAYYRVARIATPSRSCALRPLGRRGGDPRGPRRAATGLLTTLGPLQSAHLAGRSLAGWAPGSAIAQWYPQPSDRLGVRLENAKSPAIAGLFEERLKGLEPSTFCMASGGEARHTSSLVPANGAEIGTLPGPVSLRIHRGPSGWFPARNRCDQSRAASWRGDACCSAGDP